MGAVSFFFDHQRSCLRMISGDASLEGKRETGHFGEQIFCPEKVGLDGPGSKRRQVWGGGG